MSLLSSVRKHTPPAVEKIPHKTEVHGLTRTDNYHWLNQRKNPEVIQYLKQENEYLEKVMAPVKSLRNTLFEELKGRIPEDDQSAPYKKGNYLYYHKFVKGGEYPVYCRKKVGSEQEEILLDGNKMAKGNSYFHIEGFEVSDNESLLLYSVDTHGRYNYTLHIKDLTTGEVLKDRIENTESGNYAWAADNQTVFYIKRNSETLLGDKVFSHKTGSNSDEDLLLYTEDDNQFYMGLYRVKSGKYIAIISEHQGVTTEYNLIDAHNPSEKPFTFLKRKKNHEYFLDHVSDRFYIRTNQDNATNFQIMGAHLSERSDTNKWETILPTSSHVYIEDFEAFTDYLAVQIRSDGLTQIQILDLKTNKKHFIPFSDPVYAVYLGVNKEQDSPYLRYEYTSMTTPQSSFHFNFKSKKSELIREQKVADGFTKENYISERISIEARDGVNVPVSLVYHKNTPLDGSAPLLQYGYGAYGISIDANFNSTRLSLLDRGFIFAIAHIRGGQELGRAWYDQGRMFNKMNTFTDFIDCSKALISLGYAHHKKLYAKGGSAGGLLMGAVINLKPELYNGIIAVVPFVDVVNTMLDESIPLTTGEFEEWGNPKIKSEYDYIMSYSPYDNVEKQNYPNILVTTGINDSQVQYWEPAKWVAKLRELKTNSNLLLFHTNLESGHGGSSGRFNYLKDLALEYSFIIGLNDN